MNMELVDTIISPDILDTIGRSFQFRHGKGVAEWLKNSLDQYLRLRHADAEPLAGNWPVLIDLIDANNQSNGPSLAVIDFGGTDLDSISAFFLHWGDTTAATHGKKLADVGVTGGHGNGGKFYMREMWRDGLATSLVVQKRDDKKTGYWQFKAEPMDWREALGAALPGIEHLGGPQKIEEYLEQQELNLVRQLDRGERGLTVVAGMKARQALSSNDVVRGGRWDAQKLVDSIRSAPQARRPMRELAISVLVDGVCKIRRLEPQTIPDDPQWPPVEVPIPGSVLGGAHDPVSIGDLRICKAGQTLTGSLKERHTFWVLDGDGNPIASYAVKELPIPGHSPMLEFIHGDMALDFDGLKGFVQNDRERLVPSDTTDALLAWTADRIWELVKVIDQAQRETARKADLELASILNDQVNEHAKRFLEELQTEIMVDVIEDEQGGGTGHVHGDGKGSGGGGTGGPMRSRELPSAPEDPDSRKCY